MSRNAIGAIALAAFLALSAVFSAAEIAFSSSNKLALARRANGPAPSIADKAAFRIAERFSEYLPVILLGNNISNTFIATLATRLSLSLFPSDRNHLAWIGTALSTIFVIIFCETVPKMMARRKSISISRALSIPLQCLCAVIFPITWIMRLLSRLLERANPQSGETEQVDEEEIAMAVGQIRESGAIDTQEEKLLVNSLDFDETCVFELATHRVDIDGIDMSGTVDSAFETATRTPYSRLLAFEKSRDCVIGMLFTKSILKFFASNPKASEDEFKETMSKEMFPALFVHMTMDLSDCLTLMKKEKKHLAVINDEYGGTYGIITMEDVLESLSGEIWDESDKIEKDIEKKGEGLYFVKGDLDLENLLDELGVAKEDALLRDIDSSSVGGLAFEMLDRLPKKGDCFDFAGFRFTVTGMKGRRVKTLQAERLDDGQTN